MHYSTEQVFIHLAHTSTCLHIYRILQLCARFSSLSLPFRLLFFFLPPNLQMCGLCKPNNHVSSFGLRLTRYNCCNLFISGAAPSACVRQLTCAGSSELWQPRPWSCSTRQRCRAAGWGGMWSEGRAAGTGSSVWSRQSVGGGGTAGKRTAGETG